ncbi:hypothetical protein N9437_03140 [Acidimicrobiia bacterium]|nr:hypothetical protein [Acidimicrobiia bacterium]
MIKIIFNSITLSFINFIVLSQSSSIDIDQLYLDFQLIGISVPSNENLIYLFIGLCVSVLTIILIIFLKPFIEIYLLHYWRYSFYLLINLLSLSTIYIAFRIYGYSRFLLLIYLLLSTTVFILSDKNYFINK